MKSTSLLNVFPLIFCLACRVGPIEGEWQFVGDMIWSSDSCNLEEQMELELSDSFDLTLTESGFNIDDLTKCTLDGSDFNCVHEEMNSSTDMSDNGVDALLEMTQTMMGSFSDSRHMLIETGLNYVCNGTDCEQLAEAMDEVIFPCESTWSITAEYRGPKD